MAILVDSNTRILVQGITGDFGSRHAKLSLDYGTQLVAGVTPGKGGQHFEHGLVNALDPEEFAGRGLVRYGRPGHIPSSVNLSFLAIVNPETQAYLPPEQLREQVTRIGALEKDRVITYCGGAMLLVALPSS